MQLAHSLDGKVREVFLHIPGSECEVSKSAGYAFGSVSMNGFMQWLAEARDGYAAIAGNYRSQGVRVHVLSELLNAHKEKLAEKLVAAVDKARRHKTITPEEASTYLSMVEADPVTASLAGLPSSMGTYCKLDGSAAILLPKPYAHRAAEFFALVHGSVVLTPPFNQSLKGEYSLWSFAFEGFDKPSIELHYPASGTDFVTARNSLFVGFGGKTTEQAAQEVFWRNRNQLPGIEDFVFVDIVGRGNQPQPMGLSMMLTPALHEGEVGFLYSAGLAGARTFVFDRAVNLEKFSSFDEYLQSRGCVAQVYGCEPVSRWKT